SVELGWLATYKSRSFWCMPSIEISRTCLRSSPWLSSLPWLSWSPARAEVVLVVVPVGLVPQAVSRDKANNEAVFLYVIEHLLWSRRAMRIPQLIGHARVGLATFGRARLTGRGRRAERHVRRR